jgi:hypothetical protein
MAERAASNSWIVGILAASRDLSASQLDMIRRQSVHIDRKEKVAIQDCGSIVYLVLEIVALSLWG